MPFRNFPNILWTIFLYYIFEVFLKGLKNPFIVLSKSFIKSLIKPRLVDFEILLNVLKYLKTLSFRGPLKDKKQLILLSEVLQKSKYIVLSRSFENLKKIPIQILLKLKKIFYSPFEVLKFFLKNPNPLKIKKKTYFIVLLRSFIKSLRNPCLLSFSGPL